MKTMELPLDVAIEEPELKAVPVEPPSAAEPAVESLSSPEERTPEETTEQKAADASTEKAVKPEPEAEAKSKPPETKPIQSIPPEEEQARNVLATLNALMTQSPQFQRAYWEALEEKGMLAPEFKTMLETERKKTPPKQRMTEPELQAKIKELSAAGKEQEALDTWAQWKFGDEIADIKKSMADERNRREALNKAEDQKKIERIALDEVYALAAAYPELVEKTHTGGINFKDKDFHKEILRITRGPTLNEAAEWALFKLGRLAPKRTEGAPQPRPRLTTTAMPSAPRGRKLDRDEIALAVNIEEQ